MSSRRQGGAGGGRLTSRDAIEQLYQLETGHSREEIKQILKDCGGDVHEASNQLFVIPPFEAVMTKKEKAEKKRQEKEAEERRLAQERRRQDQQRRAREARERAKARPKPEATEEVRVAEVVVANGDAAAPAEAKKPSAPSMADIIRGAGRKPTATSDRADAEANLASILASSAAAAEPAPAVEYVEPAAAPEPEPEPEPVSEPVTVPEKAPERERDLVGSPAGVISLPPSLQHHAAQSLDVQFGGLGLGRDSPATSPRVDTSTAFSASFGLTSQGVQASEPAAQTDAPALSKPRDTQPQQAPGFPPTQPAAPQQQAQPQPQAQGQAQPYSYYGMQGSSNAMPSYYGYNHFAMASNTPSEGAQAQQGQAAQAQTGQGQMPAPGQGGQAQQPQPQQQQQQAQQQQPSFNPTGYGGLNAYARNYGQTAPSTSTPASAAPPAGKYGAGAPGMDAAAQGVPAAQVQGGGMPFQQNPMAYGMNYAMYPNAMYHNAAAMYYGGQYPGGYTPYPPQGSSGVPNQQGFPSGPQGKAAGVNPNYGYGAAYGFGSGYGGDDAQGATAFQGKDSAFQGQQGFGMQGNQQPSYSQYSHYSGYGYSMPPSAPQQTPFSAGSNASGFK